MTHATATLTVVMAFVHLTANHPAPSSYSIAVDYTPNVTIRQGALRGVVMGSTKRRLPQVAQYKGIPYAAPPVGKLRFMPPNSAPSFLYDEKNPQNVMDTFKPVCPQKFPETETMTAERREHFFRLQKYLMNQSEDCLYLNIYAPYQGKGKSSRKYPVLVFIHGESFEWNSGNPYDGSVLAGYGNVVVVTLNYRLGVLGFLKAGTEEDSKGNFGLVDQIAALVWVKANIEAFGGDPNIVTLLGHGTGAVCASLLMLSPMVQQENKMLFQRAILMGGSALSDWALAANSRDVTYQVAKALNCQLQDDFAACLRRKRLDELLAVSPNTYPYRTRFGPIVDAVVVPNDPKKLMTTYNDIFRRFELMYGVTEMESIHLLSPEALKVGILEKERDQELRKYLRSRCEMRSELCVMRTLAEYADPIFKVEEGYTGHEPDRALLNRDALLDIFSDARTVAPMVQMAKYHAVLNLQSYFYVFTRKTANEEHLREKSSTGAELPYVFGVPLGGPSFHFNDHYTEKEKLFSEIIMTYFCNFAYTGDPNVPRKSEYQTLGPSDWIKYHSDWPEFDLNQQQYIQLDIPAYRLNNYREDKMKYWNEEFPDLAHNRSYTPIAKPPKRIPPFFPPRNPPPRILSNPPGKFFNKYENFEKPYVSPSRETYGTIRITGTSPPDNMMNNKVYGTVLNSPDSENVGTSTTITIAMGSVFLLSNVCLFLILYLRCYRKKKLRTDVQKCDEHAAEEDPAQVKLIPGCNFIKMVGKSSRSDDTYEAVKSSSSTRKLKLPRQMSTSTIDAHTKVRDWITNEIVYKYSPRFLRRPRRSSESKTPDIKPETSPNDNSSTLGRSPTRPVTPVEKHRPPLIKSSSIPVQKSKKIEKVSVAIDATPSGRGNSVLAQQPIELTKSLDRPNFDPPLRRSLTLDDFSVIHQVTPSKELRKSTTSINLKLPSSEVPTVIRIEHSHSKSDPVQDTFTSAKKLKTFDPNIDVNVTCREEIARKTLTPEESLMTIKRRNFPKVLPDYPSREALAKKRRSMPVANHLFSTIQEVPGRFPVKNFGKLPPAPPLRTTSTLSRKGQQPQPVCVSAPMLAPEPPASPEPEVACNNLYVGPLIPKKELSSSESSKLNTQPIYESLRPKVVAKTIITTDPVQPIRKVEPKVVIKPTMVRSGSAQKKGNIPRVMLQESLSEDERERKVKPSLIPTMVKGSKESSSSESTPSEESDTGTVVKKM